MRVEFLNAISIALVMSSSVWISIEDVASSIITIGDYLNKLLAITINCFYPILRLSPPVEIFESNLNSES